MKKYITTNKHPFLRDGIRFDYFNTKEIDIPYISEGLNHITRIPDSNKMIIFWESNGYIKELQIKEFTKDDMIEFSNYLHNKLPSHAYGSEHWFNEWLKQRKNG